MWCGATTMTIEHEILRNKYVDEKKRVQNKHELLKLGDNIDLSRTSRAHARTAMR